MKSYISLKDPFEELNKRYPLEIHCTSMSKKYVVDKRLAVYYTPSPIPRKELGLFSHVRSRAEKRIDVGEILPVKGKVIFTNMSKYLNENIIIRNLYEIDINKAYWQIAKNMGIVSKEMFDRYNVNEPAKKIARNMSIGSMNTMKHLFYSEVLGLPEHIESVENYCKDAYWNVAKKCSDIIMGCREVSGSNYLFSWVDAIFVMEKYSRIGEYINDSGHSFKTKRIRKMVMVDGVAYVYEENSESPKVFNFPSKITMPCL